MFSNSLKADALKWSQQRSHVKIVKFEILKMESNNCAEPLFSMEKNYDSYFKKFSFKIHFRWLKRALVGSLRGKNKQKLCENLRNTCSFFFIKMLLILRQNEAA